MKSDYRRFLLPIAAALVLCACSSDESRGPALSAQNDAPDAREHTTVFRDLAAEVGLQFTHVNGASGEFHMPEIMGAGAALFDYDNDGDLDVYLVQGGTTLSLSAIDKPVTGALVSAPVNQLFRNEIVPSGKLQFVNVTPASGLAHAGYGMGVATGDIDSDGDEDLYLTNFGPNALFRNEGDGRFTDITATGDTRDPAWSTSAAFCDYDQDGDLDLYVTNYVSFNIDRSKSCSSAGGKRDYCGPDAYPPVPDRLYENDSRGGFRDVSVEGKLHSAYGPGLGVSCVDLDGDERADFFVANDGKANQLWLNRGSKGFLESGLMSGTAYNASGSPEASMGVTAGDFDGDGDQDLFVTHLISETNTLYVNQGDGRFRDETAMRNLGFTSQTYTGFGTRWFDYDNDGLLDLFIANGNVKLEESRIGVSDQPFEQKNNLFHNQGHSFEDVSNISGEALHLLEVSRGAAFGDIDNDGDVDIVLTNNSGPVRLLRNEVGTINHWLTVTLVDPEKSYPVDGARVALLRAGKAPSWRRVHSDGSYLSASDRRVHFGLGQSAQFEGLRVRWSDGKTETWHGVTADQAIRLVRGEGSVD